MLIVLASFAASVAAQSVPSQLVGTWTTKSGKVLTGPSFYDPVQDRMIEPSLTGISYSFTSDGHYEEAYYRALSNPVDPNCVSSIMQWQHGVFTHNSSSHIVLEPIAVDGRQALSSLCSSDTSSFTHYSQPEVFKEFRVYRDNFNNKLRLDLFHWDGAPANPMWLAHNPPEILPTTTLHPTQATPTSADDRTTRMPESEKGGAAFRRKRAFEDLKKYSANFGGKGPHIQVPLAKHTASQPITRLQLALADFQEWWTVVLLSIVMFAAGLYLRSCLSGKATPRPSSAVKQKTDESFLERRLRRVCSGSVS